MSRPAPDARLRSGRSCRADVGACAPPRIDHRAEAGGLVRRAHRKLVIVELAEHHSTVAPELRGHGGFVRRHEIAEDFRAGGGAHAFGREQILDAERNAAERTALALRNAGIGRARHGAGLIRRFQHKGIERARRLDRLEMRVGQFKRRKGFVREAGSGLGERQRCQIGHLSTGLQKNGDSVLSLAGSSREIAWLALSAASS